MDIKIVEIILDLFKTHTEQIRFNIDSFEQQLNDAAPNLLNECFIMIQGMKLGIYDTLIFDDLRDYSIYMDILLEENFTIEESIFMLKCFEKIIDQMHYHFEVSEIEKLYHKALDTNNIPILTALSNAYYKGFGVRQDFEKALEIMTYLSNEGYHYFDAKIGYLYEHGYGTSQDKDMALFYYSNGDTSECHYIMGTLYMSGKYVEKDYNQAIRHFEQSSEPNSYYYLGVLLDIRNNMQMHLLPIIKV